MTLTLTLGSVLASAGIDASEALLIRHVYRAVHTDGAPGINANSDDERILAFTANQSVGGKFPVVPPRVWVVFLPESGARARLWRVVVNHGETGRDGTSRDFDLEVVEAMADLRNRLVIEWPGQINWVLPASGKASGRRVLEIADAEPLRFPGFDALILDWDGLQAMVREHRYASWRTAMSSVQGIYLITDLGDGSHYVGKADGAENLLRRWTAYANTGHGGNVGMRGRDPSTFQFSVLRVYDPSTPEQVINAAESHYKRALGSVRGG